MLCLILSQVSYVDKSDSVTAHYELSAKGKPTTRISYTREVLANGTMKLIQLRNVGSGKQAKSTIEAWLFAKDGSCTKATAIAKSAKGSAALAVTFLPGLAAVTLEMTSKDKKSRWEYPVPKGLSTENASRFWFVRTQPKLKAKVRFAEFAISTLAWKDCSAEYRGLVTIKHEGKTVQVHKVIGRDHVSFLDRQGVPVIVRYYDGYTLQRR